MQSEMVLLTRRIAASGDGNHQWGEQPAAGAKGRWAIVIYRYSALREDTARSPPNPHGRAMHSPTSPRLSSECPNRLRNICRQEGRCHRSSVQLPLLCTVGDILDRVPNNPAHGSGTPLHTSEQTTSQDQPVSRRTVGRIWMTCRIDQRRKARQRVPVTHGGCLI